MLICMMGPCLTNKLDVHQLGKVLCILEQLGHRELPDGC